MKVCYVFVLLGAASAWPAAQSWSAFVIMGCESMPRANGLCFLSQRMQAKLLPRTTYPNTAASNGARAQGRNSPPLSALGGRRPDAAACRQGGARLGRAEDNRWPQRCLCAASPEQPCVALPPTAPARRHRPLLLADVSRPGLCTQHALHAHAHKKRWRRRDTSTHGSLVLETSGAGTGLATLDINSLPWDTADRLTTQSLRHASPLLCMHSKLACTDSPLSSL